MNVRLATPADVPAIQALERQAETAAHWSVDSYHSIFAHGGVERTVLVFDNQGFVRGFIVARVVGDEWDIENIVVEKPLRRTGIASALIRDLIHRARAQSARRMLLEVRQSNAPARKFYDDLGFVECGRRPGYYQAPEEDAICYQLELNGGGSKTPGP